MISDILRRLFESYYRWIWLSWLGAPWRDGKVEDLWLTTILGAGFKSHPCWNFNNYFIKMIYKNYIWWCKTYRSITIVNYKSTNYVENNVLQRTCYYNKEQGKLFEHARSLTEINPFQCPSSKFTVQISIQIPQKYVILQSLYPSTTSNIHQLVECENKMCENEIYVHFNIMPYANLKYASRR